MFDRRAILSSLVSQTIPLFKPPYLVYFCVCSILHFGTFSVSGGMAMFLPDVLNKLAKSRETSEDSLKVCDVLQKSATNSSDISPVICDDKVDLSIFIDSSMMGVFFLIGFIALSSSIKTLGRRKIFSEFHHVFTFATLRNLIKIIFHFILQSNYSSHIKHRGIFIASCYLSSPDYRTLLYFHYDEWRERVSNQWSCL